MQGEAEFETTKRSVKSSVSKFYTEERETMSLLQQERSICMWVSDTVVFKG